MLFMMVIHLFGKYIKNNYCIALMIDQRVSEGKRLPFFEHSALTTTLPAQLALKYNLDIVPVHLARKKDNKSYHAQFHFTNAHDIMHVFHNPYQVAGQDVMTWSFPFYEEQCKEFGVKPG